MGISSIQWTDFSWNPIIGCHKISPGCQNCYAEKMANRLRSINNTVGERYREVTDLDGTWSWNTHCDYEVMLQPYEWKKSRKIFVGSMTDVFFHARTGQGNQDLFELFKVMEKCPQHTFQMLTKRPVEMNIFMERYGKVLPNVWIGVTICNQEEANFKIPILLNTPAVCRYISIEPMLDEIDLTYLPQESSDFIINGLTGIFTAPHDDKRFLGIDWVILGGETGPKARPMQPDWALKVFNDCQKHNVPFFFKSWGTYWNKKVISSWNKINLMGNTPFHRFKEFPYDKKKV